MKASVILSTRTFSEKETMREGEKIATRLAKGDIVACYGDLGAGKTSFIKGICGGLGIGEHVSSPTFTIINEYHCPAFPVYHFDFYRLNGVEELREIGFEEYVVRADGVCLIEWAEKVRALLPLRCRYDVEFAVGREHHIRSIVIRSFVES